MWMGFSLAVLSLRRTLRSFFVEFDGHRVEHLLLFLHRIEVILHEIGIRFSICPFFDVRKIVFGIESPFSTGFWGIILSIRPIGYICSG